MITGNIQLGFANTTVASTLKLESTSSLNNAIAISSSFQTLEIGASAFVTLNTLESITNGTIKLDGGTFAPRLRSYAWFGSESHRNGNRQCVNGTSTVRERSPRTEER